MNVADIVRTKDNGSEAFFFDKSGKPVPEAENVIGTVRVMGLQNNGANHIVQPRAQAAAGHDSATCALRVEKQAFMGTGGLKQTVGMSADISRKISR